MDADTNVELSIIHSPPRSIMSPCDNGCSDLIPFLLVYSESSKIFLSATSFCWHERLWLLVITNRQKYCLSLTTADTNLWVCNHSVHLEHCSPQRYSTSVFIIKGPYAPIEIYTHMWPEVLYVLTCAYPSLHTFIFVWGCFSGFLLSAWWHLNSIWTIAYSTKKKKKKKSL